VLEIDPINRQFQYFINGEKFGSEISWKNLSSNWNETACVHPAISFHTAGEVAVLLRVCF